MLFTHQGHPTVLTQSAVVRQRYQKHRLPPKTSARFSVLKVEARGGRSCTSNPSCTVAGIDEIVVNIIYPQNAQILLERQLSVQSVVGRQKP